MDKNNANQNYFTKKRLLLFSIIFVLIIVFIILFSKFVLDIDFNSIGILLNKSSSNKLFYLWLLLLLVFPIFSAFWRGFMYMIKLREDKIYVKWYDWLCFVFVGTFINSITPFSMGCEPFNIFWLKSKGVSLKRATVIVSSTLIFGIIAQIIVTWPSYFYVCSLYPELSNDNTWTIAFWFTTGGLFIDLLSFCFFWLLSYSRRVHYLINIILNFFKRKLKLKYKTKEEIKLEFINNATFKQMFKKEMKKWKQSIVLFLGNLLWNIFYYFSLYYSFKLLDNAIPVDFLSLFNYVNVAVTANNFIPIPGSEGTTQLILRLFISNNNNFDIQTDFINNSIFIWRLFSSYIPSLIGLVGFISSIFIYVRYKYNISLEKMRISKDDKNKKIVIFILGNKKIKPNFSWSSYKNVSLINIDYDTNITQIKKHVIGFDYFIFLNEKDILRKHYIDNLILNINNNDMLFASYTNIKIRLKKFILMKECWMKKSNDPSSFIYHNKLSNCGVLIKSSLFLKNYRLLADNEISMKNNELIYSLYLLTMNISFSNVNFRLNIDYNSQKNNKSSLSKINDIANSSNISYHQKVLTINNYKNNSTYR